MRLKGKIPRVSGLAEFPDGGGVRDLGVPDDIVDAFEVAVRDERGRGGARRVDTGR